MSWLYSCRFECRWVRGHAGQKFVISIIYCEVEFILGIFRPQRILRRFNKTTCLSLIGLISHWKRLKLLFEKVSLLNWFFFDLVWKTILIKSWGLFLINILLIDLSDDRFLKIFGFAAGPLSIGMSYRRLIKKGLLFEKTEKIIVLSAHLINLFKPISSSDNKNQWYIHFFLKQSMVSCLYFCSTTTVVFKYLDCFSEGK